MTNKLFPTDLVGFFIKKEYFMSMVFCSGCGKEIHETAITCPQCGAPQKVTATTSNSTQDGPVNAVVNGFWNLAIRPLKMYAEFKGRARRKEYWFFILFIFMINFILGFIGGVAHIDVSIITSLITLGFFIPNIAVGVRRMHDSDHSGWWLLLPIVNLVFLCFDSTKGQNRFGNCPK